eukprot:CAMPEP_0170270216 /NCGR_PEP_ID=MMETSP0116_2-20130129/35053_1 /TAXON_ID=400756 /ORGANISM="Durinskia baltica, Strain CSIRO CS-38" /LENGTH=126 /DNA_ID=CAMNT_0010521409 /DNA_START=108 /DNA_END=488 /DNA_ORIENTATION=+
MASLRQPQAIRRWAAKSKSDHDLFVEVGARVHVSPHRLHLDHLRGAKAFGLTTTPAAEAHCACGGHQRLGSVAQALHAAANGGPSVGQGEDPLRDVADPQALAQGRAKVAAVVLEDVIRIAGPILL